VPCLSPFRQWCVGGEWINQPPRVPSFYQRRDLPCGQCAQCRLSKASQWNTRLVLAGVERPSVAVTLTYDPEHVPLYGSLCKKHVSAFVKRLRARVAKRRGEPFSFDCIGEYSPELLRPHYHLACFGYVPVDAKPWAKSRAGNDECVSAELTAAWGKGLVTFQYWSTGAARYIANHQAWKLTGHASEQRLRLTLPDGSTFDRAPEFHLCSTRPGIGRPYMEKHGRQALLNGFTFAKGKGAVALPKYFVEIGKKLYPAEAEAEIARRVAKAKDSARGITPERMLVLDECAELRIKASNERKTYR